MRASRWLLPALLVCAGCATAPAPQRPAREQSMTGSAPKSHRHMTDQMQQAFEQWYKNLPTGSLQPNGPQEMYYRQPAQWSVTVSGPETAAGMAAQSDAAGGGSAVKVSDYMKVLLSCPDNPGEFKIENARGSTDVQFVPDFGSATWSWVVTPEFTAKRQRLLVTAWVIDPDKNITTQEREVYSEYFTVAVPSVWQMFVHTIESDPNYWLHYMLPGGAGFIFLAGIVTWLWRRCNKKQTGSPGP